MGLYSILVGIPGVLLAITFHEFAHGYAAYKLGDDTAQRQGRLSLNPLAHIDIVGLLLLIVAGFGWGKPVQVNPSNYTRKISMEKGQAIVSAAGPIMNFLLAFVFMIVYCIIYKFAAYQFYTSNVGVVLVDLIIRTIYINIGLGVFNLIPLPPLDGSKIIMPFLPSKVKYFFEANEQKFYIAFIVIWVTGIAGYIITPAIYWIANSLFSLVKMLFFI